MSEFPLGYDKLAPATWAYLSSLLMIGLYFKFNRIWSVRNLDLLLLILLAPGLLFIRHGVELKRQVDVERAVAEEAGLITSDENVNSAVSGDEETGLGEDEFPVAPEQAGNETPEISELTHEFQLAALESLSPDEFRQRKDVVWPQQISRYRNSSRFGFIFVFVVGVLLLFRMLIDSIMVRRPLLEPNLTPAGLCFIGCSLFVFLVANVITSSTLEEDLQGTKTARQLVQGHADEFPLGQYKRQGPGYPLISLLPVIPTAVTNKGEEIDEEALRRSDVIIAKTTAVIGQLLIVAGLVLIGARHFNNLAMGIGAATLYLMLPYTAMMTGRVTHVVPAALMVWAIASYRRPLFAGSFLGLAMGLFYYPLFLLPLWISFYWRRGVMRFLVGFFAMVVLLGIVLAIGSSGIGEYFARLAAMFGVWSPQTTGLQGIWALGWDSVYRLPMLALFIAMSVTFAVWPAQKNFGTLLSCSCAVMIAVQFWHGFGGGLFMAWYLPLLLLTVFRPNLEDRVAHAVLGNSWFFSPKRQERRTVRPTSMAA